jgi:hypothetical protein
MNFFCRHFGQSATKWSGVEKFRGAGPTVISRDPSTPLGMTGLTL